MDSKIISFKDKVGAENGVMKLVYCIGKEYRNGKEELKGEQTGVGIIVIKEG